MWHTKSLGGKLPQITMTDGPHGLRKQEDGSVVNNNDSKEATCFPTESGAACSWDPAVVAKMASAIADEAIAEKVSIVLGCGANIKRSPLCGRNFEYFSEDPYLTGTLAAAYIKAMEAKGVATSLKHFAANNQETHRQTSNSQIDERAFREIYLTPFEIAVKQGKPSTVMASYNRINGTYACENRELLTDILRNEWKFDGVVVSDWGACTNLTKSIHAGMDLEMPDNHGIHEKLLREDIRNGRIPKQEVNASVKRILSLIERQHARLKDASVDYSLQHEIAKEIATASAVLLKNESILPISPGTPVTVIGEMADHMRYQGGGSSHIHVRKEPNAIDSLKEAGLIVTYKKGYCSSTDHIDLMLEEEAIEAVKNQDVILFFGGLTEAYEGEGYDRTSLDIPYNQIHLLKQLHKVNPNVVFITCGGAPMDFNCETNVRAILQMYLGGQAVADAVADLIIGKVNPSGKLAESYPYSLKDIPCNEYYATGSDDVEYRESLFVGYRYYTSYQVPVRYCFGYGLSYTTFEYSNLNVSVSEYHQGTMKVSCDITNTGLMAGKEVVQLYIKNPNSTYLRPKLELRGFQKVSLEPGETKTITIELNERSFSIYDDYGKSFLMPSGNYVIQIGASCEDIRLQTAISVSGVPYDRDDRKRYSDFFQKPKHGFHISQKVFASLYHKPLSHFDLIGPGEFTTCNSLKQMADYSLLARIVLLFAKREIHRMLPEKESNDPEVMMLLQGVIEGTLEAVIIHSELPHKLADAIVLSANGEKIKALLKLL